MDRVRDLLAVLFLAYAAGAAVTVSRAPTGQFALPFVENALVAGLLLALSSGLVVAGLVLAAGAVRAILHSPREIKVTLVLGVAFWGFLVIVTWMAAPFDVRGEQWIASNVSSGETALLRWLAVGLLLIVGALFGWLYAARDGGGLRNARIQ